MVSSFNVLELVAGLALAAFLGWAGYRRGALNVSGVVGGLITGSVIFGLGGWEWGLLLVGFFVSSSALSFYRARDKERVAEKFSKGHRRDIGQALANAGMAAALAVPALIWPSPVWFAACVGAFATVNADTWATELGVLSVRPPRLITTGKPVEVGTSGGVSWLGTGASLAGAALIGALGGSAALVLRQGWTVAGVLLLTAALSGLTGSLFDSLLGATVQAIYWCDTCSKETERIVHRCGNPTRQTRGWRWLQNDVVNFLASALGAVVGAAVGWWLL